jgi:hypothetical protein
MMISIVVKISSIIMMKRLKNRHYVQEFLIFDECFQFLETVDNTWLDDGQHIGFILSDLFETEKLQKIIQKYNPSSIHYSLIISSQNFCLFF